jgi:hypothetical protein
MKGEIKKLHVQRTMWKSYGRNFLHWVFCVNYKHDDVKCPQTMKCIIFTIILFCFVILQPKQEKV